MASNDEMKIKGGQQQQTEGKPNLDCIAQHVQNLFKFNKFYDLMDFNVYQRVEIMKVNIKLTDSSGGSSLV